MALWLVATPIGTLGDASPRMREVLGQAAAIACEDTRTTRKLLGLLGVSAPELFAVHAHNEEQVAQRIAERAASEDIALVSDAGTPGVSDPGSRVVSACHAAGVSVLSVPGPSALAAALAASGFPAAPSTFLGFPPRKGRETWVRETLLAHAHTVVLYEAPGRTPDLVKRIAAEQPDRELCLCREISKRFEEVRRDRAEVLAAALEEGVRGECVLVVGPGEPLALEQASVEAGASLKDVAAVLAERWGVKKREAYQRLLALESEQD